MATTETLTIVLKADGSGLTGTLRTAGGQVQQFGAVLDATSGKVTATGAASRRTARDVDTVAASARHATGSAREWATSLNTLRGTLAALGVSIVARELLGAGLAMDRLERSTAAALGSQALAARELGFVREQAQRLGIYFPTLAEGYAGLAAATRGTNLQGEKTREIFLGVAEAGRAMNLSTDAMKGVLTAVQQIAGKGTVSMEELRQQLGDRLPGAMQIAARSMGMTVAELVKLVSEGKIASEDFLPKFAAELRKSAAAGVELAKNSPAATFERMKTALFDVGVEAARSGGILETLATAASGLTSVLNVLAQSGAIALLTKGLLTAAAAGAVFYVGGLLQRGFIALTASIALANAPVAGLAVGLTGAAVGAQRVTVGMMAASAATRGLGAALAFVQANPIALAVTAVAMLVGWLYTSQRAAKQAAEEIRQGFTTAKQALDDFNASPSLAATFTLADAKAGEAMDNLRERLVELREEQEALAEQQARVTARFGNLDAGGGEKLRNLAEESASLTRQLNALELGAAMAAGTITDMALRTAELGAASPQVRSELMGVSSQVASGNLLLEDALPKWQSIIERFYGAEVAARLTADGIREIVAAASGASEIVADLDKSIAQLNIRLAGLKGGDEAEIRLSVGYEIMKKGGPDKMEPAELAAIGRRMLERIRLTREITAAEEAQSEARKGATAATREQKKSNDDLLRGQEQWRESLARTAAELSGPLAVAEFERDQRLKDISAALAKNYINETQATEARRQANEEYRRNTAEIRRNTAEQNERANVMGRLRATMEEEINLSKLSTEQRRIEEMVLRTVEDAKRQNVTVSKEEARAVVAAADVKIRANEDHIRSLEDLQDAGVGAFQSMAQAMGDFVGRGFRGVKDMWSQIKDAFKRGVSDVVAIMLNASFVRPLQNWLGQMLGLGGSQGLGGLASGQGGLGAIMNNGFDRLLSGITGIFSRGGSAAQAMQTATEAGWQMAKAAGVAVVPVGQAGGMMLPNGSLLGGGGSIFGGLSGMLGPLLGVGLGASMGGDTLGKIGGGLTGGALAYSMLMSGGGLAGLSAGMASGGLFGGLSGMAGAMGPIGWTALAAMAVNKLTGGKLFGTSYKTESASQQWSVSEAGASGSQSVTEVKQQSFFRGRKWKTTTSALDAEAMAAVNELFLTLEKTVQTAAQQLGIDVPDIVGGSFKREFDKNGNLTREFGTIAGRVYNEAQDAFAARLVGENLLAVAKAAGSSAELEQLANAYRATGEELQSFATLALAVQEDLRSANGIWKSADGDGVMTRIVEYIEGIAKAGESLADAYARVQQTITQYGDLIGGVRTQLATRGLNQYQKAQLDVELAYRSQVKQANELAKALGLSGARAEDLAAIEQLRALNMADLAQQYAKNQADQNKQWLAELGLSDLSPLRDDQKLAEGMNLLREAVGAGDAQRAQKLAEQVLGLGRNLYASGADYAALYNQVTGLVGNLPAQSMEELQGLTNEQLATLADLVGGLPEQIAQELAALLVAPPPATTEPQLPPAPTPQPPPPSGGGGGGGYDPGSGGRCVAAHMVMDDGTLAEDADAGNVHATHDPAEGFMRHAIRARGEAVWQPCVRLVTVGGAALVCSASTPFTAPDAPADLPEYTTLAPDMLGRDVIVERAGLRLIERVVDVQDVGMHLVIPLDFGGRSFPAGEDAGALIYSHNMQKVPDYQVMGDASTMGIMSPQMADSFDRIDESLLRIADGVERQNKRLEALEVGDLNSGPRVPWKGMPRNGGGIYY